MLYTISQPKVNTQYFNEYNKNLITNFSSKKSVRPCARVTKNQGLVQNEYLNDLKVWGTLLFRHEELAFINLRSLLSSLLKALHVCLFATLNNKRILFVGSERVQPVISSLIGSQKNLVFLNSKKLNSNLFKKKLTACSLLKRHVKNKYFKRRFALHCASNEILSLSNNSLTKFAIANLTKGPTIVGKRRLRLGESPFHACGIYYYRDRNVKRGFNSFSSQSSLRAKAYPDFENQKSNLFTSLKSLVSLIKKPDRLSALNGKLHEPSSEATLGGQKTNANELKNYFNTSVVNSFFTYYGKYDYTATAKTVSKAARRSSQWTFKTVFKGLKAPQASNLIGGYFSNSKASYKQCLSSTTMLNLKVEFLKTTILSGNNHLWDAIYTYPSTRNSGSSRSLLPTRLRALSEGRDNSNIRVKALKRLFSLNTTSSLIPILFETQQRKLSLNNQGIKDTKTVKNDLNNFKEDKVNNDSQDFPHEESSFVVEDRIKSGICFSKLRQRDGKTKPNQSYQLDQASVKSGLAQPLHKKVMNYCFNSIEFKTKAQNPWLKEADLVFFTNPCPLGLGLLNQINRLKIPTIGIINSGSGLAFPFRVGKSSLKASPTLTYPIFGNSNSLNFIRLVLTKFKKVLCSR
jgi:hypothetical protein